jgi:glutamine synthetase
VNSYRRLWDTGFWAPVYADWGYQNRTCATHLGSRPFRISLGRLGGQSLPDGGRLLKAFDDGIRNKLDRAARRRNIYAAMAMARR